MKTKEQIHGNLCHDIHQLYLDKNADYGESFSKLRKEFPESICIRLSDKLNRLTNLMKNPDKQRVKDESIDDTLMDIANYALLELTERKKENDSESEKIKFHTDAELAMDWWMFAGYEPLNDLFIINIHICNNPEVSSFAYSPDEFFNFIAKHFDKRKH